LVFLVLEYPTLTNLGLHYVWGIYMGIFGKPNTQFVTSYITIQAIYHIYYFFSMILNYKILKYTRYIEAWKRDQRYMFFPFYGMVLLCAFSSDVPFSWLTSNVFLSMAWHTHIQIIREMNHEDLQQIQSEHE
jgi:hypothetical protein